MFSKICLFALLALVAARRPPRFPQDFKWSSAGPVRGWRCVRIHEGADRQGTWHDNYFCQHPHTADIGMAWSSAGPIKGKRCVQVIEPAEPPQTTWRDNYLCTNHRAPRMRWSYNGPKGACVQWLEAADPHTWRDNYMCRA